jgi:HSP20 family protein
VTDTFLGAGDLTEEARQLLAEIDQQVPGATRLSADCRPPTDVIETPTGLEVVVDVPGVTPGSLRVAVRRNVLLVVGAKIAPTAEEASRYHLAERSYGRFARIVRLEGAFDIGRARAATSGGQLRIQLPRLEDRRGRTLRIAVNGE